MKAWKGVLEKRLRQKVKIDDMQFGFVPGKGTVDAIFMMGQLPYKRNSWKRERIYSLHLWT